MVSPLGPVFLVLAAILLKPGLSIENLESELKEAETVVKRICRLEYFRKTFHNDKQKILYLNCTTQANYVAALQWYQKQDDNADDVLSRRLGLFVTRHIEKTLPRSYGSCANRYLNEIQSSHGRFLIKIQLGLIDFRRGRGRQQQKKSTIPDPISFKNFTNCLKELIPKKQRKGTLQKVEAHLDSSKEEAIEIKKVAETLVVPADIAPAPIEELAKEIEKEEEEKHKEAMTEEEQGEEANKEEVPKFSTEDVEYGLTQAKKVAAGICWIEKLSKPYPKNDGGSGFLDCKKNHDYSQLLQKCLEGHQDEDVEAFEDCWENAIRDAVEEHLPGYSPCLLMLQDEEKPPNKNYGDFLGDTEKSEYPYKGYTHCLLEELEDEHGQQGLDDLKSKWENPKTLVETMLQRENEHRSWHSSPPLEIDEELTLKAQSYADHLAAEVCAPTHMLSNDPEKRYNGSKCGENVSAHSDLTLSDDEMAAMAAVGWYKENELYPWPLFNGSIDVWTANMVGHFTQTVWKDSIRVGYAISRETPACQKIFVVARYWPVGNKFYTQEERTRESFEKNVLPSIQ